jgi:hypothetical protein
VKVSLREREVEQVGTDANVKDRVACRIGKEFDASCALLKQSVELLQRCVAELVRIV